MKIRFFKYIFPALYGLLNYFTIRLLQDTQSHDRFWERKWQQNALEICTSILVGYIGIKIFRSIFEYFDRRWTEKSYQGILKEMAMMIGANLILMNAVFTPLAAFTDDGLSLSDFVEINLIPTFYALTCYGILRSRKYVNAFIETKIQIEKLTNDQLNTELKFLKAQYHPHFLFNALNTIYFQMDEDVPGAKRTVERFSEILRYQLYNQHERIDIVREFDNLKNYIELQQTRTSGNLNLQLHLDEPLQSRQIYPLLLLPLVENAFKFVGGDYRLMIDARMLEKGIEFTVENSVRPDRPLVPAGGIGLENLKRRLDLLYPGTHHFTMERGVDRFKTILFLPNE